MSRVVVTGMGAVSPLGVEIENIWKNLLLGHSGISKISKFDVENFHCQIAAQVKPAGSVDGFDPLVYVTEKDLKKMDPFIVYAIAASRGAIKDSGWLPSNDEERFMTGTLIASGIGGLETIEKNSIIMKEQGHRRISPFFIPASLANLASGHVSIEHGYMGANFSVVSACASGSHAIGEAYRMIKHGYANVMVAGGAEAPITPVGVAGFQSAKTLACNFNDNPELSSRPWDRDRAGFVMGEGAAILVLENLDHALKRGAKIYAEIIGYGSSSDAYHITSPHPEGRGAKMAMDFACKEAKLMPEAIDYINAHATSTIVGDEIELNNICEFFASNLKNVSMSSTKSSTGHLLGAAGSLEAVFSILAMRDNIMPPTLNLDNPPADCPVDLVPLKAKEKKISVAMSNSFGFGGTNATLIFKKLTFPL
jgi:3-oxoacyl-[acyl-carrier-protein] synthase II